MKSPGIMTTVNGKNKTLYMQTVEAIRKQTKANLPKKLTGKIHCIITEGIVHRTLFNSIVCS